MMLYRYFKRACFMTHETGKFCLYRQLSLPLLGNLATQVKLIHFCHQENFKQRSLCKDFNNANNSPNHAFGKPFKPFAVSYIPTVKCRTYAHFSKTEICKAEQKVTSVTMDQWDSKWKTGKTGFHREVVHDDLVKHEQLLLSNPSSRVFVPLCGKTVDMKYIADKGHEVVGLEFSEKAVSEFFEEHSLTYKIESKASAPMKCYRALNSNISIFCGDIFQASAELIGKFDAVWDRGSFVAIDIIDRQKYALIMSQLVKPDGCILLNSFVYDPTKFGGPPHNTPLNVIEQYLKKYFYVKCLDDSYDYIRQEFKEQGLDNMIITNYLLTLNHSILNNL